MTEWKSLKELWEENGCKPFDAVPKERPKLVTHIEAVSPSGQFIGWDPVDGRAWADFQSFSGWNFHDPKPELVPHWPAIFNNPNSDHYGTGTCLFHNEDSAVAHAEDAGGKFRFVRLAKEYPAIYLPRKK